ncbi:hypothetical protein K491DRAFT_715220 [Lophiostoma macrostomum CBS 122681]|uniref:F-box domain-containing protein n=1 Tax=Lophiostoma macrostomum CBS 122681 TaxID=1314788 RepID=A0A6A6TCG6_9PLEO|nr:hypothetical protein K491DRAFT_715220 [Lophiostoma macrostomum CBS 122681]
MSAAEEVPPEVWLIVFERLSHSKLIKCMRVCQGWRRITLGHNATWKPLFLGPPPPDLYDVDPTSRTMTISLKFSEFIDDRVPTKSARHIWETVATSPWFSPRRPTITFHPFIAQLPYLLHKMNRHFEPKFRDPRARALTFSTLDYLTRKGYDRQIPGYNESAFISWPPINSLVLRFHFKMTSNPLCAENKTVHLQDDYGIRLRAFVRTIQQQITTFRLYVEDHMNHGISPIRRLSSRP